MVHDARRRRNDVLSGYEVGPDASRAATDRALRRIPDARSIVLVEGVSDQIALETLARRNGIDLDSLRVVVLPINGAQAAPSFLQRLTALAADARLSGLCDVAEERFFIRGLAEADIGEPTNRHDLAELGFFVCIDDLEDELIRAVGEALITDVLEDHGDLPSLRTLQKQSAWAGRPFEAQMHRWLRAGATRNLRYAQLLVETLEPGRIPLPLDGVLASACA